MGIFSSILGKLGFGEDKVQAAAQAAQVAVAAPATAPATTAAVSPPAEAPSGPAAISEVDVVGQLTMLAEAGDAKLN